MIERLLKDSKLTIDYYDAIFKKNTLKHWLSFNKSLQCYNKDKPVNKEQFVAKIGPRGDIRIHSFHHKTEQN